MKRMKIKNKQFQNKKADMQFWLVMLVLALIFLVVMFFVTRSVFEYWGKTTSTVQKNITKESETLDIFENLGSSNSEESTSEESGSSSK